MVSYGVLVSRLILSHGVADIRLGFVSGYARGDGNDRGAAVRARSQISGLAGAVTMTIIIEACHVCRGTRWVVNWFGNQIPCPQCCRAGPWYEGTTTFSESMAGG